MQPADSGPRNPAVAAAAAAVLGSQSEDLEDGRVGAGGMMATPASGKRRGLRGWTIGERLSKQLSFKESRCFSTCV